MAESHTIIRGVDPTGQPRDALVGTNGKLQVESAGGGGGGGGVVEQGAQDVSAAPWWVILHDGSAVYVGAKDSTLQAVRDRLPAALDADGGLKTHVQNALALDAATLAALETTGLDAATLAALESIIADTELPAAETLGDAMANPTTPLIGAALMLYDSVSALWARAAATADGISTLRTLGAGVMAYDAAAGNMKAMRGDTAQGLDVDVTRVQGTVTVDAKRGGPWTWTSAKTVAPGIGAVQADTGALSAGDYEFHVHLSVSDTVAVGKGLVIEHRNAANGATLQNLGGCPAGSTTDVDIPRITLALNERIRVIAGTAAGAASSMYVSSIGRRTL